MKMVLPCPTKILPVEVVNSIVGVSIILEIDEAIAILDGYFSKFSESFEKLLHVTFSDVVPNVANINSLPRRHFQPSSIFAGQVNTTIRKCKEFASFVNADKRQDGRESKILTVAGVACIECSRLLSKTVRNVYFRRFALGVTLLQREIQTLL